MSLSSCEQQQQQQQQQQQEEQISLLFSTSGMFCYFIILTRGNVKNENGRLRIPTTLSDIPMSWRANPRPPK